MIFLIISSNNVPQYKEFKELSKQYYSLYSDDVKYFYIEYKSNIEEDIKEEDDHLFIKGTETDGYGIYMKTVKAIQYINSKYNYSFIFRTNLSSFLHIKNILEYLQTVPNQNFASGWWNSYFLFSSFY